MRIPRNIPAKPAADVATSRASDAQKADATKKQDAAAAKAAASNESVKVRVSDEAVRRAQSASAGIDHAKVERLREAVQKGTFKVDPKAIAAKILEKG